jgi:hypothetical protein
MCHIRGDALAYASAMASKDEILFEIQRCARENEGHPLGKKRFENVTGIRESDWLGRYWARWGDAVQEAGFSNNVLMSKKASDEDLVLAVAELMRELGHFPTAAERKLYRRSHPAFPSSGTIDTRIGKRQEILKKVLECVSDREDFEEVTAMCESLLEGMPVATEIEHESTKAGYVYLISMGNWHKIGCTTDILRRRGEIRLTTPEPEILIHTIETDDPYGVEHYWHRRFADKRTNGEWFDLDSTDVRAFKRWRKLI